MSYERSRETSSNRNSIKNPRTKLSTANSKIKKQNSIFPKDTELVLNGDNSAEPPAKKPKFEKNVLETKILSDFLQSNKCFIDLVDTINHLSGRRKNYKNVDMVHDFQIRSRQKFWCKNLRRYTCIGTRCRDFSSNFLRENS